jgi:hypothetical protein
MQCQKIKLENQVITPGAGELFSGIQKNIRPVEVLHNEELYLLTATAAILVLLSQ